MRRAIIFMVVILISCALFFSTLVVRAQKRELEIRSRLVRIIYPRHRHSVGQVITVEGEVELAPGQILIILARQEKKGWWFQQTTERSGRFSLGPTYIGRAGSSNGEKYYIAAVIIDKNKAGRFKQWYNKKSTLSGLEKHQIVVLRK
ncbi:MAG: hypothetical protein K8T10_08020 [Candidatus Eremiobacteraeota bacterium]|nr:hypothetical protein [Candidatus Eremiobacteraeota bacterium]